MREERGSRDNLQEIIKEEKNHEVGALSHIQQIQTVQISFNTPF